MKKSYLLVLTTSVALITGCAAIPEPYRPSVVGAIPGGSQDHGLRVTIQPDRDVAAVGDRLQFLVRLTNAGPSAILVPRRPNILFTWVYPDGRRDNFMLDDPSPRYYPASEVQEIPPGESLEVRVPIETYYFKRYGVTEFRAIARIPRNTNPAHETFWHGKVMSNAYGVLIEKKGKRPIAETALVRTSATLVLAN